MPIPPSLFEPFLKRQWAKKHLDSVNNAIGDFSQSHPYQVFGEEDVDSGEYRVKIIHPPLTEAFRIVLAASDFANCLRASLDYLAWQLALTGGGSPGRDCCFPIYSRDSVEVQNRITKATFGMPESAISIVKSLQPYNSGEGYQSTHLWRLSMLCNINKHRHVSAFRPLPPWQFKITGEFAAQNIEYIAEQIDNCTVIRLPLEAKDYVDFNSDRTVDIRFFDQREGLDIGYQDLIAMYDFVGGAIQAFAGFFPP
jgi:hypothetical protein